MLDNFALSFQLFKPLCETVCTNFLSFIKQRVGKHKLDFSVIKSVFRFLLQVVTTLAQMTLLVLSPALELRLLLHTV